MKIIINGKTAILRKGTSFKFVSENCSVMLRSISVFIIGDILNLLHAVSRSITGCFVQQNIGEVSVRTEGLTFTAKNLCNLSNPSPQKLPFLRSLPYILRSKTQGRKSNTNSRNKIEYSPLSLPLPVALRGIAL